MRWTAAGYDGRIVQLPILKRILLRNLMFCALVVFLTACTLSACQDVANTATAVADTTATKVPTHKCTNWNYKTSAYRGLRAYGRRYIIENDVWNPERIHQTLYSCNFDSYYIEANVHDEGGAVQSYPSSQYTFGSPVKVSKFKSLTSEFRVSNPPAGSGLDYEFAYDIWLNGYGGGKHTEMMIWTYNDGQRPAGSELPGTIDIGGHQFEVWVDGGGGYIVTFEAVNNYTAGNTDLLPFLSYAASHGWLYDRMQTPLWQIDYGVELCATPFTTKFDFTDFSVAFKT
jgi:hypothetical protein